MKYLFQFCIIMIFVAAGELLAHYIPLQIAGSIYGLILLFLALVFGVVKLSWVEDCANFLHSILALLFVAPAVAIIDIWADISNIWWILMGLLIAVYLINMTITGVTAEILIKDKKIKRTKTAK